MRVLFINNSGTGFADYVDVAENTSIEKFLTQRLPDANPADYLIRVNRQPCARDQVLHEGDRISATPTKVEGGLHVGPVTVIQAARLLSVTEQIIRDHVAAGAPTTVQLWP